MRNEAETERLRIADLYAGMTDDELLNVARDLSGLTEIAQEVMTVELGKRRLQPPVIETHTKIDEMANVKIVVVAHFMDMPQALVAKAALDSAGIESFLAHDNASRIYWSSLTGGVRLEVAEGDAEQAVQVLNEPLPGGSAMSDSGEYAQPDCPKCGSAEVDFIDDDGQSARWSCVSCGHGWAVDESPQ